MPGIYLTIAVVLACMTFFIHGARADRRSTFLWGALSLGSWIAFTELIWGGLVGGIFSQVLLFVALTAWSMWRDDRAD